MTSLRGFLELCGSLWILTSMGAAPPKYGSKSPHDLPSDSHNILIWWLVQKHIQHQRTSSLVSQMGRTLDKEINEIDQLSNLFWSGTTCVRSWHHDLVIPFGNLTYSCGNSPFLVGKSTMSMVIFSSYKWHFSHKTVGFRTHLQGSLAAAASKSP